MMEQRADADASHSKRSARFGTQGKLRYEDVL